MIDREFEIRSSIVNWGKELYDSGMVKGSGGNISVRLGEEVILTPTGYFLGHLRVDDLSKTDLSGNLISGPKPTKETPMHLAAYRASSDVSAVVHVHSPFATAMASTFPPDTFMPIFFPSVAIKVGRTKITAFQYPGTDQLANTVYESLKIGPAVLLANHGIVTSGKNIQEAMSIAYEIEENAHIYYITNGEITPLDEDVLNGLLRTYGK